MCLRSIYIWRVSESHEPLEIPGNVIQSLGLKITLLGIPLAGRSGGSGLKSLCLRVLHGYICPNTSCTVRTANNTADRWQTNGTKKGEKVWAKIAKFQSLFTHTSVVSNLLGHFKFIKHVQKKVGTALSHASEHI